MGSNRVLKQTISIHGKGRNGCAMVYLNDLPYISTFHRSGKMVEEKESAKGDRGG